MTEEVNPMTLTERNPPSFDRSDNNLLTSILSHAMDNTTQHDFVL